MKTTSSLSLSFIAPLALLIASSAIASPSTVVTVAGAPGVRGWVDGPAAGARFNIPSGVAVDSGRNVYICDGSNTIRKLSASGVVSTFAGSGTTGSADGNSMQAQFNFPQGVAVDSNGAVYVADTFNSTIRKIDTTGNVTTLAGLAGAEGSADGLGSNARFNRPRGIAVDGSGNVYVADLYNHTIRKISPSGNVVTIAGSPGTPGWADDIGSNARFYYPGQITVDSYGCLYVTSQTEERVRKLCPSSSGYIVATLAGDGTGGHTDGTPGSFNGPAGVAVDRRGNVYVAESVNNLIRRISPSGDVTTLAGTVGSTDSQDGTGASARFYFPCGLAATPDGDLHISDEYNQTIRYASNADSDANYDKLTLPNVGEHIANLLTDNLIELKRITTRRSDGTYDAWNFVDANGNLTISTSDFHVSILGTSYPVAAVSFKRRPLYARDNGGGSTDLRIETCIYLQLQDSPGGLGGWPFEVTCTRFPEIFTFEGRGFAGVNSTSFDPTVHVNQVGYLPNGPKHAYVGYYLGPQLGDLAVPSDTMWYLYDSSGQAVASGYLTACTDAGWNSAENPAPYQHVKMADFSSVTTPGLYVLRVGPYASRPFRIDDGVAMNFVRTFALGLYNQRCGAATGTPYTLSGHSACHTVPAQPLGNSADFTDAWSMLRGQSNNQTLTNTSSLWYPYPPGPTQIDVTGGHHDAGDYNKYTIDSALLISNLMFTADNIAPQGAYDNLGIPESGNGISDLIDEAKIEADYLVKLQDRSGGGIDPQGRAISKGGFYTATYAKYKDEQYNANTLSPSYSSNGHNFEQVVWPISTTATAAAVAALAECASSPSFRSAYGDAVANDYLSRAIDGWNFLQWTISTRGYGNTYQKVHFYGDTFADADELAWAACELYLATGQSDPYQSFLEAHFDPSDRLHTYNFTWDPMFEGYGNAARSYCFAGLNFHLRRTSDGYFQVERDAYWTKCLNRVTSPPADDPTMGTALTWSQRTSYGASLSKSAKQYWGKVGYFSALNVGSPVAMMQQITRSAANIQALTANLDFEAGANPNNAMYISGLGMRRPREIVSQLSRYTSQYAGQTLLALPPVGLATCELSWEYDNLAGFGGAKSPILESVTYPADYHLDSSNNAQPFNGMFPVYDRWVDVWNTKAEYVIPRLAGELMSSVALANGTMAASSAWNSGSISISADYPVPMLGAGGLLSEMPVGGIAVFSISSSSVDLGNATIVWQGMGRDPVCGSSFTYVPTQAGTQAVTVDVTTPDGRRLVQVAEFTAYK